jgi:hypothetical protein
MLAPKKQSAAYSNISQTTPSDTAKQNAKIATKAGLNEKVTVSDLFNRLTTENPNAPNATPLKACNMVSQCGTLK